MPVTTNGLNARTRRQSVSSGIPSDHCCSKPLGQRAIQAGLRAEAVRHYVRDWTVSISDVTGLAHEIRDLVAVGNIAAAGSRLPAEHPYPVPPALKAIIGAP